MRIAHVIAGLAYGGAERVVVQLADGHAAAGLDVAVVAAAGELDRDWRRPPNVVRVQYPRIGRHPVRILDATWTIRTVLRDFGPDVLHAHNVKAAALAMAAARSRRRRVPVLATMHGVSSAEIRPAVRVLRRADAIVAVSRDLQLAMHAAGLPEDRVQVVANGVETPERLGPDQRGAYDRELDLQGLVVAAVGRIMPQKAHERFVDAAAQALSAGTEMTFLLVGDGPTRPALEQRARDLGIAERMRFTGERGDARALIDRADIVVFSSEWEGHSIAALEALAAGTPVVSTAVAGMRDLLGTGAGVVVESWDARDLGDAVARVAADPELRRRMGTAGQRLVAERYSAGHMLDAYLRAYEELLRRQAR